MSVSKSICLPGTQPVDIGSFLPLLDSPYLQRLRGRKQLGVNELVFPGARHSRLEHAIGVLALTQQLCRIQQLPAADAKLLQAHALLHDIGHGPFSHQIESVLHQSHHERGVLCLKQLSSELHRCGLPVEELIALQLGQHFLSSWIADRNLGTDKLDYLRRDAWHIGFHGIPDIDKILYNTVMTFEGLAIKEKYLEDAKQLQKFYSYLHQHGYLNKSSLAAQRLLQRAVQEELLAGVCDGEKLWDMTDRRLLSWLEGGRSALARELVERLENRHLHRSFLVLKPQGYGFVEKQSGKDLQVLEWPRSELRRFCEKYEDLGLLRELEDELCADFSLSPGSILFAAMPYFTKLIPKDLRVFTGSTGQDFWLLEKDADHRRSLESDYLRTFAIRLVCVPEERLRLSNEALDIAAKLQEKF